ncbi:hypothetical protein G3O08_15970 [Cryomorpha ignava]|uniref:Uncharacterized protein n=2 Tax=Cryomorpha ignava TaxID=101383 RepID=A0A7K3WTX7_9FLAO|nr:hypothetical protein [Cryomorpha ignava]
MEVENEKEFGAVRKTKIKSLFLSNSSVEEILESIKVKKFKGRLKGELNQYIQNWEYYPQSNAVNFLCKRIPIGNIGFFTDRIQDIVQEYNLDCSDCNYSKHRHYFLLSSGTDEIKFFVKSYGVDSIIIYNWVDEPNSEF